MMNFTQVRQVTGNIWPLMQESIRRREASREVAKSDPHASRASKDRANQSWERVIVEETVWKLSKEGYLVSPGVDQVVRAAREWARGWANDIDLGTMDAEESRLYDAVQALATADADPDRPVLTSVV